jgi:hypothetical protein
MISMNEEKAVAGVISDIRSALGGRDHEIVIVDSSRDAAPECSGSSPRKAMAAPWRVF